MSGWGCPHEEREYCHRMHRACEPGTKGCILYGKITRLVPEITEPESDPKPEETSGE